MNNNWTIKATLIVENEEHGILAVKIPRKDGTFFFRVPGGTVEPGENAAQAIIREIQEELDSGICGLNLIDVLQNHFVDDDGRQQSEVEFVFIGSLSNTSLYNQTGMQIRDDARVRQAYWISIDTQTQNNIPIYPGIRWQDFANDNYEQFSGLRNQLSGK